LLAKKDQIQNKANYHHLKDRPEKGFGRPSKSAGFWVNCVALAVNADSVEVFCNYRLRVVILSPPPDAPPEKLGISKVKIQFS
jgi:hypothetical protein